MVHPTTSFFKTGGMLALVLLVISLIPSCYYDKEEELYPPVAQCDTTNVSYQTFVAPLMKTNCNACHNASAPSAGIATDSYDALKTIALNGRLYGSVAHIPGYSPMPKGGNKLSDCNLKKLKAWINAGAPNN